MDPRSAVRRELAYFALLALGITWLLDLPFVLAAIQGRPAADYALSALALSACGPTIAALLLALRSGRARALFGRWRVSPCWLVIALLTPMALHLAATSIYVGLGGVPAQWLYLPTTAEHVAALVLFSVGEEFGWRGFAYPRFAELWGPVPGSLLLGGLWALWHLLLCVSPETGTFDHVRFTLALVELPLLSLIFAALFERGGRSMAVAIALHMGLHLDNVARAPLGEHGLWGLRLGFLAIAAGVAARALLRRTPPQPS